MPLLPFPAIDACGLRFGVHDSGFRGLGFICYGLGSRVGLGLQR